MTDNVELSAASWRVRVKHLTDTLLSSIFPPVCVNCGSVGELLCAECMVTLPRIREPWCPRCGRMVIRPTTQCISCRQHPLRLREIRAVVEFAGAVPGIIHKMKYGGMFALAEPLADLMVSSWPGWSGPVNLVLSIPLHPQRRKQRGYNQSELLAGHLRQKLDMPGDLKALWRVRHTKPQVDLSITERLANVTGAFRADRERVHGKEIVLVDDVCTTGSTLSEAARALSSAGAKSVSGFCLARAV